MNRTPALHPTMEPPILNNPPLVTPVALLSTPPRPIIDPAYPPSFSLPRRVAPLQLPLFPGEFVDCQSHPMHRSTLQNNLQNRAPYSMDTSHPPNLYHSHQTHLSHTQLQPLHHHQMQLQSPQPQQVQPLVINTPMQLPPITQGHPNMPTAYAPSIGSPAVSQVNPAARSSQEGFPTLPGMHSVHSVHLTPSHTPVQRLSPLCNSTHSPYRNTSIGSTSRVPGHSQAQLQVASTAPQNSTMYHHQPSMTTQQRTPTKPQAASNPPQPSQSLFAQNHNSVITTPAPQSIYVRDAALVRYWKRLEALLKSARSFMAELQPVHAGFSRPNETPRQIAYDLQGLTASAADAHVAKQDESYQTAYGTRAAGDFIEYGVISGHAVWAAHVLAAVVGSSPPSATIQDFPLVGSCPDEAVENVRIRIFEAEVSCLPVEFVEELLKRRRSMRRFKNRIDLCVRILLALEGRGRRPAQASLDRMKLQLEKADIQARAEVERDAARKERERQKLEREQQKQERERQKYERVKKTSVKIDSNKKRKRQQSAQANFMMRFVKKDEEEVQKEEIVMVYTSREGFAAPLAKNRDVMSVAWWLRTEMPASTTEKLDKQLNEQRGQNLTAKELLAHLTDCAKQREVAERRIHVVLREYRQTRKLNTENRTPVFTSHRANVRGKGITGPVKLLQFAENRRPAYFGTFSRRSRLISGRRPLGKDIGIDYECDSADEWDEDEEGEDLLDVEADTELATEEAELKRLYGSDDEDDDDFLDDADEDDEDGDEENGDEDESGTPRGPSSQEASSPSKEGEPGSRVIDLTLSSVKESKGEQNQKRPAKDDTRKRNTKRRKGVLKQSVVIHHVSIPNGSPSPLDRFAVSAFEGSQPIQMFNPFVYTSSDVVAEHLKAKPPSLRVARASNMDESTKLDLAAALMRTGSTKDKIVLQFCEHRKLRGLAVPTKAEIMRAIGEIATKEKRDGDSRALWHLKDQSIARKMAQMNNSPTTALPHASSVAVD